MKYLSGRICLQINCCVSFTRSWLSCNFKCFTFNFVVCSWIRQLYVEKYLLNMECRIASLMWATLDLLEIHTKQKNEFKINLISLNRLLLLINQSLEIRTTIHEFAPFTISFPLFYVRKIDSRDNSFQNLIGRYI